MNPAIVSMLSRYSGTTTKDYENALKEILQEIALLGLWRAKFFEHAAFYGGTALRILYGLDRFSEDLDFSLLGPQEDFSLAPYLKAIETELIAMGFDVSVEEKKKSVETAIESAFIKANTLEHFLKINVPQNAQGTHKNAVMSIKLEVDTQPPGGFETEAKTLLQPIPFSVKTYKQPDLFAGKLHAILQRSWKNRVKGRDYYDLVWYLSHGTPVHLSHLELRLRQSGGWNEDHPLDLKRLLELLREKISQVNFEAAKRDVTPFLRDPSATDLWSSTFFGDLLTAKLKAI
ncbi:MAG: nucleotidyl transferase AbiEii/AbiGii toxin family protein [Bdellovibrionia bacterium]